MTERNKGNLSQPIPPLFTCIFFYPLSNHLYLFLCLFQSKFTPILFNPVFFITVYTLYIHLYQILSLFYPPIFLYISLPIQIDAYLVQPHFIYHSLSFVYPPVSVSIPCLPTTISCLCRFRHISFNPLFLISAYPSYIHLYRFLSLVYPLLSLFISCLFRFTHISFNLFFLFYLFANPTSRLPLSIPFSLSQSIPHLSTCI